MRKLIRNMASNAGLGLVAGAAGTAAMTVAQMVEMRISGRTSSSTPAEAIERLAGVEPKDDDAEERLATVMHWVYGTGLGALRGALGGLRVPPKLADSMFFATVWGAPMAYLPSLELAPPVTEWPKEQLTVDAMHHLVYAAVVGVVFRWLGRPSTTRELVETALR